MLYLNKKMFLIQKVRESVLRIFQRVREEGVRWKLWNFGSYWLKEKSSNTLATFSSLLCVRALLLFSFSEFSLNFFSLQRWPNFISTADWGLILRLIGWQSIENDIKFLCWRFWRSPKKYKSHQNNSRAALEILISHPFLCKFSLSTHPTFDLLAS